jgi:hypothetical protein
MSSRRTYGFTDEIGSAGPNRVTEPRGEKTMNNKDSTYCFCADQSPKEVFEAINNLHGWWSEHIDGRTDKLGAEFKFRHKDLHRGPQKITICAKQEGRMA